MLFSKHAHRPSLTHAPTNSLHLPLPSENTVYKLSEIYSKLYIKNCLLSILLNCATLKHKAYSNYEMIIVKKFQI